MAYISPRPAYALLSQYSTLTGALDDDETSSTVTYGPPPRQWYLYYETIRQSPAPQHSLLHPIVPQELPTAWSPPAPVAYAQQGLSTNGASTAASSPAFYETRSSGYQGAYPGPYEVQRLPAQLAFGPNGYPSVQQVDLRQKEVANKNMRSILPPAGQDHRLPNGVEQRTAQYTASRESSSNTAIVRDGQDATPSRKNSGKKTGRTATQKAATLAARATVPKAKTGQRRPKVFRDESWHKVEKVKLEKFTIPIQVYELASWQELTEKAPRGSEQPETSKEGPARLLAPRTSVVVYREARP